jgi:hypothetical protein
VDVEYRRRRGNMHRAPHFPQVKDCCQREGIDCLYPQSPQVSKMISAKQDMQWYFTASSPTGLGILQSGQVK